MKANKTNRPNEASLITSQTGFSPADDLVTRWDVSADDAKRIYESWLLALARRDEAKRCRSEKDELLNRLRAVFWMPPAAKKVTTSQRLYELASAVAAVESDGEEVPPQDIEHITKERFISPEVFRDWIIRYWIVPVQTKEGEFPLCCFACSAIIDIYEAATGLKKETSGDSIRQEISDLGLLRPTSKEIIRKKEYERMIAQNQANRSPEKP